MARSYLAIRRWGVPAKLAIYALTGWLIVSPQVGTACWIYDGIFIGALMTRAMLRTAVQMLALYLPALALLVPLFGNHGLWAALMLMNFARGITLYRAYPSIEAGLKP